MVVGFVLSTSAIGFHSPIQFVLAMPCTSHYMEQPRRKASIMSPDSESSIPARKTRTTKIRHDDRLARLIERAARALTVDKSTFLRAAIEREATRVIDMQSRHTLTLEDAEIFAAALDVPPTPTPRALEAARHYRARVVHAD